MATATATHARLRAALTFAAVATLAAALATGTTCACAAYYNPDALSATEENQTTVRGIIAGDYAPPEPKIEREALQTRLESLEKDKAARIGDPDFANHLAYLLLRRGRGDEADRLWAETVRAHPTHYPSLASWATAQQTRNQAAKAVPLLEKAVALRPGFRDGADRLQLAMARSAAAAASAGATPTPTNPADPATTPPFFLPELGALWESRPALPRTLKDVPFPAGVTPRGLAELLRAFPKFGDGWFALGMALEHAGEDYQAGLCYQRALGTGATRAASLAPFVDAFRERARRNDPARSFGPGLIWTSLSVLVGFIAWRLFTTARAVKADVTEARIAKTEAERRHAVSVQAKARRHGRPEPPHGQGRGPNQ